MKTLNDHLDLVDETVKYYSEDVTKRSTNGGAYGCSYYNQDSKGVERMCAVGRCLIDPTKVDAELEEADNYGKDNNEDFIGQGTGVGALFSIFDKETIFKPEYKGFKLEVWSKLQDLHDNEVNWSTDGLSEQGKSLVTQIKNHIKQTF